MVKFVSALFVAVLLFSCGSSSKEMEEQRTKISDLETTLKERSLELPDGEKLDPTKEKELIELLKNYYQNYPEDKFSADCLAKLHMIYSGKREYRTAAKYGDTLISNYKDYINRTIILESMASTYDIFIQPRDSSKVRYYNELILTENKDLSKDKREEIEFRLKHNDLTIEELIEFQLTPKAK